MVVLYPLTDIEVENFKMTIDKFVITQIMVKLCHHDFTTIMLKLGHHY